jgi:glycine reductase
MTEGLADEVASGDARIRTVAVDLARPGDSLRICCVKDVVEPRAEVNGRWRRLSNVAVVTCGPIVGYQEGIIDMSGPGADYTPFSRLDLVVVRVEVVDGLTPHEHEEVVRQAGLRAAEHVARSTDDTEEMEMLDVEGETDGLPRLAYLYMLLSQGLLHDTYVEGRHAGEGLPRIVEPHLGMRNGIVSGNCVSACDKSTTWHHQNNPVIRELLRGHGSRWNLAGVVLTNEPTKLAGKTESAARAVELVEQLGADGAVISKEGFGNPDADLMMLIRGLEQRGIRTVAITDEYAGGDGGSPSLADVTPEADALVSTGNANERITLPPMDRVIGSAGQVERLSGAIAGGRHDDGSMEIELQLIMGSTSQLGGQTLTCVEV